MRSLSMLVLEQEHQDLRHRPISAQRQAELPNHSIRSGASILASCSTIRPVSGGRSL